jgi:hypothetical protein
MDTQVVIGFVIVGLAYGFILYLIIRSRKTIETIAHRKSGTLREILQEIHNDKKS